MEMSSIMNTVFTRVKRPGKLRNAWKEALVVLIHKRDKTPVIDYRPLALLDIARNGFERCIYQGLYQFFANHLVKEQYGFVKNRLVRTNIISFVQRIHFPMDINSHDYVVLTTPIFLKRLDVSHTLMLLLYLLLLLL